MPFSFVSVYKSCEYKAQSYKPALAVQREYLCSAPWLPPRCWCWTCQMLCPFVTDHADNTLWWLLLCLRDMCRRSAPVCKHMPPSTDHPLLQKNRSSSGSFPPRPLAKEHFSLEIAMASFSVCGVSMGWLVCWAKWDWAAPKKGILSIPKGRVQAPPELLVSGLLMVGADVFGWYPVF